MKRKINKIRVFWLFFLALIVFILVFLAIAPMGKMSYKTDFKQSSRFIQKLSPAERIEAKNIIIGDPVYFSLYTPRTFDQAIIRLRYKNQSEHQVIEAGVLAENLSNNYQLQPVENRILDGPNQTWFKISEGGLTLWQREKKYISLYEFLGDLKPDSRLALYNYDLDYDYRLPNYQASNQTYTLPSWFLGAHRFFVYIKDEPLHLDIRLLDLNKNQQADDVYLNIYYQGDLTNAQGKKDERKLENETVEDRGQILVDLSDLAEGVYEVELKTNNDIVSSISTNQSKLVFSNKVNLFSEDVENINLWSDISCLNIVSASPTALQSILIDKQMQMVDQVYQQFEYQLDSGLKQITLEKGGLNLEGSGFFSFSPEAFFQPKWPTLNQASDLSVFDYILADYISPFREEDWQIAEVHLNLKGMYRYQRQYKIVISIPGLKADDDISDSVIIDSIEVDLSGKSLWQKLKEII